MSLLAFKSSECLPQLAMTDDDWYNAKKILDRTNGLEQDAQMSCCSNEIYSHTWLPITFLFENMHHLRQLKGIWDKCLFNLKPWFIIILNPLHNVKLIWHTTRTPKLLLKILAGVLWVWIKKDNASVDAKGISVSVKCERNAYKCPKIMKNKLAFLYVISNSLHLFDCGDTI